MKKKLPVLTTDAEAEAFVDTADLSEYDLSEMVPMRFEMKRKDKSVNLRLPAPLLEAVRKRAEQGGIPYQRFIRIAIEQALQRGPRRRRDVKSSPRPGEPIDDSLHDQPRRTAARGGGKIRRLAEPRRPAGN